ncbi:MAG: transcription antitermination factor NusB [Bacteroidales bacterium]|nr:transcription antitermination factor NusB [Bacteroidales bacterium]
MLSRHFLRAKVLQEVYAYYCSEMPSIRAAEDALMHNIVRLNDLGTTQIAMALECLVEAERVTEEAMQKFIATDTERNPDRKFIENEFARRIADNYDFKKQSEHTVGFWSGEQARFRKAIAGFKESKQYQEYMAGHSGFEADKDIFIKLFRFLVNDEGLRSTVIERSLLWEDDFDQVAQYEYMFLKTLDEKTLNEAMPWPRVYDERDEGEKEAAEFARTLLRETLRNAEENNQLIKDHLHGWEFERVAQMDIYLLDMAIAELEYCPSVPERVTVDEYIELSKEFSTDRSRLFINGLLDRLILELRSAGKIVKVGRGLYRTDFDKEEDSNA